MRLYAPLLLALLVAVHAATIPEKLQPELEKKIVIDDEKPPVENISSEPELVDPASAVIDVENKLKNNLKPEDIPVKVIVEEVQPVVKSAEIEPTYEVVEEDIKRPVVDLRNPGPPQHQEHETQNPGHYVDVERTVSNVKEELHESKVVLRQGLQGVTNDIQNWYANNEQVKDLQSSINKLQENFAAQLQKLNETLQTFLNPNANQLNLAEETEVKANYANIETGLKTLESNFNTGVQSLSKGVQAVATLRQEEASGTGSTAAPPLGPLQMLAQLISNMQTSMNNTLVNMGQTVNNFITQYQPNLGIFQQSTAATAAPVYSDVSENTPSSTAPPSAWQNIQNSWNNIINPNQTPQNAQNDQTQRPPGLFGLPSLPILTGIVNLIQGGQTTAKPVVAPQADPAAAAPANPAPEASNSVPVKPEEIVTTPAAEKKIENTPKATDVEAEAEKSEEVKSEAIEEVKPEIVKIEEVNPEPQKVEEQKDEDKQEKGGWFHGPKPGGGNPGDSDDSSSRLDTPSEESQVSEHKEEIKETEVSDKTE